MNERFKKALLHFFLIGIVLTTILVIVFLLLCKAKEVRAQKLADEAKDLQIEALHLTIQNDEILLKDKDAKIEDLTTEVNILKILNKLNDCGVCGKHHLSYIEDEDAISISCNDCYTHVDFEKKYSVSADKIEKTWNGLRFNVVNELK